jgi:hypothetical protein
VPLAVPHAAAVREVPVVDPYVPSAASETDAMLCASELRVAQLADSWVIVALLVPVVS